MQLNNCKNELKLKRTKHFVLAVTGNNNNGNPNIIFTMTEQKLSKLLSKGFERSVYWNKYKKKSEDKNITNELRYFLESNFVGVNSLF